MGPVAEGIKRIADVALSAAALLCLSPLLGIVWLLIRLSSPGPAIFRQKRAGKDMQPFVLYKFRTMHSDVDVFGVSPKSADDSRLTGIGRFLREHSLDELPQLWNVLKGEMSLVGPRPLYMSQAQEFTPRQAKRLEVSPGLTGLAQIYGRGNIWHEDKLEIDVYYVEHASLWLDLRIVLASVISVLSKGGTYQEWG
ncbi:MAG: sugar transferase [Phycisphaerae bacterium]|nr:sugar transferase [Phycisphaerae bacterium]